MPMDGDGASVLVVDDDNMNRLTLAELLEHEGYRSHTVENGSQALEALEQERFDAILLDILMPGIDGLEVLQAVKADTRLWKIPVIVISAVDDTTSIVRCLELGAEDFVSKPFDPAVLRARINAALARRRFGALEAEYHKIVEAQAAEIEALKARLAAYDAADQAPT
jgi:DNA-binding response OmpR family regulator